MVKKSDTYYEILGQPKDGTGTTAQAERQFTPIDSSLEGVPASEVRELNGAAGKGTWNVNGQNGVDGSKRVDGSKGENGQNGIDGSKGVDGSEESHPLGKINRILGGDPLGSAEEQARRRKREKRERLFSAIGDGISALSNLYYTTRYAPNAYNGQNLQSKVVGDRWDKLNKERAANHKAWVDAAISMEQNDMLNRIRQQNADANQAYKERESQRKADEAEVKKNAQEIKNAKEQAYTDWVKERAKGQGAMDEAKIEYYKTKIDCLNRGMSLKEAESKAKIAELDSRTKLNNRRGTSSWVSGSKSSGRGVSKNSNGEFTAYYSAEHGGGARTFKTKAAAEQFARQEGTWQDDYATSSTTKYGITTTRRYAHGGHSVKPKKSSPANGGGGNGKRTSTENKNMHALGW